MKNNICILFLFLWLSWTNCINLNDIIAKFDAETCIENDFIDYEMHGYLSILLSKDMSKVDLRSNSHSPSSTINEIAQVNKIEYYYYLEDEQGPAHDKAFTVSLKLGEEYYKGVGKNIKEAKRYAGEEALLHTNYKIPERKEKREDTVLTPTVELNNLCMQIGIKVVYLSEDELISENLLYKQKNITIPSGRWKSHLDRLNYTIYHPYERKLNVQEKKPKEQPFKVGVIVGNMKFIGFGYSVQAARNDAATKALLALKQLSSEDINQCLLDGTVCNAQNVKSPVSVLYEMAQKKNINLEFEVIAENGPAHSKEFITKCQFGDLTVEGKGKSKKTSKKTASENMLDSLKNSQPSSDSPEFSTSGKKKKKKNKVIKSSVEKFTKETKSFLTSTWEYFSTDDKDTYDEANVDKKTKNSKDCDIKSEKTTDYKRTLIGLTQEMGIEVNFINLGKTNSKFYSLLFLGITPDHVCLGDGLSFDTSSQKASLEALSLCHKLGIENLIPSQKTFNYINEIDFGKMYIIHNEEENSKTE